MPALPTTSDLALCRAVAAWGRRDAEAFWARFEPSWRSRLRGLAPTVETAAAPARDRLARDHAAEARPDPDQVHPSWWVRALQDEPPAVQRAVTAQAAEPLRSILADGLGLGDDSLRPPHPPFPEAVRHAAALWSERLVGGPPAGPDDPAIVALLAGPKARRRFRLVELCGLAKRAYAAAEPPEPGARGDDVEAHESFRRAWTQTDQRLVQVARVDLASNAGDAARGLPRLGLVTVARLLSEVEPFRQRWTLQHLPYAVAKFVRSRSSLDSPYVGAAALISWERAILDQTCRRLDEERDGGADPGGPP